MADARVHIQINLSGMVNDVQRRLQTATNLVAIGLNARDGITASAFEIPDVTAQNIFNASQQWSVDEAKQRWDVWVLAAGFRDVSEVSSHILEQLQAVLGYWSLVEKRDEQGKVCGEDWNSTIVSRGSQFHRRTLTQKIEFLEKHYAFTLDGELERMIRSINAARNCLVHRSGVVADADVGADGVCLVEWRSLAVTVPGASGGSIEIEPPYLIEAGTLVSVGNLDRAKRFRIGDVLSFSAMEFSQICWTQFTFALSCAQLAESWGGQRASSSVRSPLNVTLQPTAPPPLRSGETAAERER